MKKSIFVIVAILCMAFSAPMTAFADGEPEQIDLQVSIIDPTLPNNGPHKAPPRMPSVQVPVVFLDGNTLYFDTPCSGYTLQIVDEDGEIVYTVALPYGTTEWELPDGLLGEYKLQIIRGRYCFHGWIEL